MGGRLSCPLLVDGCPGNQISNQKSTTPLRQFLHHQPDAVILLPDILPLAWMRRHIHEANGVIANRIPVERAAAGLEKELDGLGAIVSLHIQPHPGLALPDAYHPNRAAGIFDDICKGDGQIPANAVAGIAIAKVEAPPGLELYGAVAAYSFIACHK